MFERFTRRARQAVVLAQEEARAFRHDRIGTEHLLLALLRDPDSVAGKALARLGVSLPEIRRAVEETVGRGESAPTDLIPFSPRAKKVLDLSLREAINLTHSHIGTEHILLGIVREGEGLAARILVDQGTGLSRVREAVLAELAGSDAGPPAAATPADRYTPAAEQVLEAAAKLAGGGPLGSHHLLEALARAEGSLAAKALAATGTDADTLAARIDEIGLDGTTDLTPQQADARRMEIRLVDDEVQVVLRDETALALMRDLTAQLGEGFVRGDDPVAGSLVGLHTAVVTGLRELRDRLAAPAAAPTEADREEGSSGALLRRALRSRLRRRQR